MTSKRFTLAMDTGLSNFGLSVLESSSGAVYYTETITTKRSKVKGVRLSSDYTARIRAILNPIKKCIAQYAPEQIVAEIPPFATQDTKSATGMSIGTTIAVSVGVLLDIPVIEISPREVKEVFTGDPNADKHKMMNRCCKLYGWRISYRTIKPKNKPVRKDPVYHVMGKKLSAGYFEHIADSLAVYHVCRKLKRI